MGRTYSSRGKQETCIKVFVVDPHRRDTFEVIKPRWECDTMEL